MDENDLDFRLRVDCQHDFMEIRRWFRENWTDLNIDWEGTKNSGMTNENWIEIQENDEYDSSRTRTSEEWFYYPYIIDVIFKKHPGSAEDVKRQNIFAQEIIAKLESMDCVAKLIG